MGLAEALPLVVLALLVLAAGGTDPATVELAFEGDRTVESTPEAYVVGGGTVTVPANATVEGELFVVGGEVRVLGRVDGDIRQFGGTLTLSNTATVTDELQAVGGNRSVAPGASIGRRTGVETVTRQRSPVETVGTWLLQLAALSGAGALAARRRPAPLATVGEAVSDHTVVSGVVGAIAGASMLVVFVYMAFTLILLPLSVVGLLAVALLVGYGYVAVGYVVGTRLPVDRRGLATALGVATVLVVVELAGRLPYLGAVVQFGIITIGLGAVLITYLGFKRFEPATIPG